MRHFIFFFALLFTVSFNAQVDVLNVDFETGIPQSFTILDADGLNPDASVSEYTSAWISVTDPEEPTDTVASATSFFSPAGTADRWLITPALTLGSYGNYISWNAKSQDASFPDDYLVLLSTTDNSISSFTDTVGSVLEENFEWTERIVNLSSLGYADQTVYIAFRLITEDGYKLYLDDIHAWKNDATELTELHTKKALCFPNPAKDIVTIYSEEEFLYCEVYDLSGKIVFVSNTPHFSISNLPTGMYHLKVFQTGYSNALRFVKI
jgi:hypothetical protein